MEGIIIVAKCKQDSKDLISFSFAGPKMHGNGVYSGLEFKVQKVAIPMRHEGESTEDEGVPT